MKRIINIILILMIGFSSTACKSSTPEERFIQNVKNSFVEKIKYYQDLKESNAPTEKYKLKYIHKIDRKNIGSKADYNFTNKKIKSAANLYFKGMENNDFIESKSYIIESIYQIKHYSGFELESKYKSEVKAIKEAEKYAYKICYIASWIEKIEEQTFKSENFNNSLTENNLSYYGINIKNSTPIDITNIKFQYTFYDEDSSTIFQSDKTFESLEAGDEKVLITKFNNNMRSFKYIKINVLNYYQYGKEGIWDLYGKTEGRI